MSWDLPLQLALLTDTVNDISGGVQSVTAQSGLINTGDAVDVVLNNVGVLSLGTGEGTKNTNTSADPVIEIDISGGTGISLAGSNPVVISAPKVTFRPAYTIYVSPNGNDTTGDGSILNPYLTIQKALDVRATITDTIEVNIYIQAGNYTENLTVSTGRTYLTGDPSSEGRESINITGNINVNITTISTIGLEYVVSLSQLQINGNVTASASASGAFVFCIYETNLNTGSLTLDRTGASGSTCVIENCRFNPSGTSITTITNKGFTVQLLGSQILTATANTPVILNTNATSVSSAGTLVFEYSWIQNSTSSTTASPLISYTNTSNSTGNRINWSRIQYTNTAVDTGTNKCCIQFNATGTTTFDTLTNNTLICNGATYTGGQPYALQKRGAGAVTLSYQGNNICGTGAHTLDPAIIKTNMTLLT